MSADVDASIRGQHAVVSGGGRGIGAAIAEALAAQGAHVTLLGRTTSTLEATAQALKTSHQASVHTSRCDVTNPEDVTRAFADAVQSLGPIRILINNAGQAAGGAFETIPLDMIVSSGYNISGAEIENVLLTDPAVAECAVIGVPDSERGQIVKAFVVLKPGHEPEPATTSALQDFVKREIAPYKYPRAIEYVESLPRTETGKLQRFRLRQMDQDRGGART